MDAGFHAKQLHGIARVFYSGTAQWDLDPKGTERTLSLSINSGGHCAKLQSSFLTQI